MKLDHALASIVALALTVACGSADGVPQPGGDPGGEGGPPLIIPASDIALPDRLVDGPVLGCVDAFDLLNQQLSLPTMTLTFDAGGILDRVAISATGATYTFALRPVDPVECTSTELPVLTFPTITFGFDYLGDVTRSEPMCINGSSLRLTGFTVTGTPLDSVIEAAARDRIWLEVDRAVILRLNPLLSAGDFPDDDDPRCANWVGF